MLRLAVCIDLQSHGRIGRDLLSGYRLVHEIVAISIRLQGFYDRTTVKVECQVLRAARYPFDIIRNSLTRLDTRIDLARDHRSLATFLVLAALPLRDCWLEGVGARDVFDLGVAFLDQALEIIMICSRAVYCVTKLLKPQPLSLQSIMLIMIHRLLEHIALRVELGRGHQIPDIACKGLQIPIL